MKERPILFSTPMVQAILEGRKTQTRRICKPTPAGTMMPHQLLDDGFFKKEHIGKWLWETASGEYLGYCPYGKPGDRLWVRETWSHGSDSLPFIYKAGYPSNIPLGIENVPEIKSIKWKPSIFMPCEACRIILEVTDVRVERLQDISKEDVIAEGIEYKESKVCLNMPARAYYMMLWDSINGKDSHELNPWVWVITFKQIV